MSERVSQSRSRPSRASVLFHLAFALGFVPLLGVVLAAVGLAAARRDPQDAGWRGPLVAVLIFDAVIWPAVACVWLVSEPLLSQRSPDADSIGALWSWWSAHGDIVTRGAGWVLLAGLAIALNRQGGRAAVSARGVLLASVACGLFELGVPHTGLDALGTEIYTLVLTGGAAAVMLATAAVVWFGVRRRFGAPEETASRLSYGAGIGLGLLYYFGGFFRYAALSWMVKLLVAVTASGAAAESGEPVIDSIWGLLAMAPASLALAPVGEEVLIRGVLFPGLRSRMSLRNAFLLSALVFALAHDLSGVNVLLFVWVGLVMAWTRHRTGGLLAPITIHVLINLHVFVQRVLFF